MASITAAVARIKKDPLGVITPDAVEAVCDELGYTWRDRDLDPATTVALFVQQILHGNTPCNEVPRLVGATFTGSAWCQARSRLPLGVVQAMLTRVCDAAMAMAGRTPDAHRWRGHRTFHIDGSTFTMPDTPELQKAFGQPKGQKKGCGFPMAHLLVLFDAATGLLMDGVASRVYTGDVSGAPSLHAHLNDGDILIGDDSFAGWAHFALLLQHDLHGLFPNHHLRIVDFTPGRTHCGTGHNAVAGLPRSRWIKSLGKDDQLVEWFKPQHCPDWMSQTDYDALPASITVRELRRTVKLEDGRRITVTIVTTLLDPKRYPADELIQLRMRRWDVETNLRHLKTTMGLEVLRCKTEIGVRKELAVYCLVYNLVRVVMLQAAARQRVPVHRISFIDTLKWMRHARPGDQMPKLVVNPARPHRIEPRCKKRRPNSHPPHEQAPRHAAKRA